MDSCCFQATLKYFSLLLSLSLSQSSSVLSFLFVFVCMCVPSLTLLVMDLSPANENDLHPAIFLLLSFSPVCFFCMLVCAHPLTMPVMGPEPIQWKWQVEDTVFAGSFVLQRFSCSCRSLTCTQKHLSWDKYWPSEKFKWGTLLSFSVFLRMRRSVKITAVACGT